jgi:hypothetical protein
MNMLQQFTTPSTGICYMWYEKRIEESVIRSILEVSFECLEHQIKAFKDSDFKDCIFTTV